MHSKTLAEVDAALAAARTTTGMETIDNGQLTIGIQKVVRDGQVLIIRDGKTYDLTGRNLKSDN